MSDDPVEHMVEMMEDLDYAVLACKPQDPSQYEPKRKAIWDNLIAMGVEIPPNYPGSIYKNCRDCGILVQVGPRLQEALVKHPEKSLILCLIDAAHHVQQHDEKAEIHSLDNPYKEKK